MEKNALKRSAGKKIKPKFGSISLAEYLRAIEGTDKLGKGLQPILLGLFGEVGGIMATVKKHHREGGAFAGYRNAAEDEFGDVLWYFAALCKRLRVRMEDVFDDATAKGNYSTLIAASDLPGGPISRVTMLNSPPELDEVLLELGSVTSELLRVRKSKKKINDKLRKFAFKYISALEIAGISFSDVVGKNIDKTRGRFLEPDPATLPTFDDEHEEEERLPATFDITVSERKSGKSYMRWNGVFIGDPLTDNIKDPDGYRFHDVFHFAHACVLHWSPTFRGLIKHKRKSIPKTDETQDGGRAIVVEEGLTAWIFARAKELNYFEGQTSVSFDLLKTVQQFVAGYEVEACPLKLWESAILQGYEVFRQLKLHKGGRIIGNRSKRTIKYAPLPRRKK